MDEFNKIRKAYFKDGLSINEIARKFKRSWATINTIIKTSRDDLDLRGSRVSRVSTIATQEVTDAIISYFEEEKRLKVKRKQRYTARKIFNDLTKQGIYHGSERSMQELIKKMRSEYGQMKKESYLPLEFELGSTVQIDHGEVDCIIEGERLLCYLFTAAVPGKALRFCQLFGIKSREAWGEFHERTFCFFKGRFPCIIYDNDTVLVKSVSEDSHVQTDFSLHLEEHYGFESHFCNLAAGNEKGAVENAVGFCRRNYLPGCPVFADFKEVNDYLEKACLETILQGELYKNGEALIDIQGELERKLNHLLPTKKWRKFDKRLVNSYQQVEINDHFYSVPEKFVGNYVRVGLGAFFVEIFDKDELIAQHARKFAAGKDSLSLDHYLDQLERKPGALWDCKVTKNMALEGDLLAFWQQLSARYPERKAQSELIGILRLTKTYDKEKWDLAIKKAIECKAFECAAVESILRLLTSPGQIGGEQEMKDKLPHISIANWDFDLSSYSQLAEGGDLC